MPLLSLKMASKWSKKCQNWSKWLKTRLNWSSKLVKNLGAPFYLHEKEENVFPFVPAGQAINEMLID